MAAPDADHDSKLIDDPEQCRSSPGKENDAEVQFAEWHDPDGFFEQSFGEAWEEARIDSINEAVLSLDCSESRKSASSDEEPKDAL